MMGKKTKSKYSAQTSVNRAISAVCVWSVKEEHGEQYLAPLEKKKAKQNNTT